ncbi:hypothetical protein [Haloplanus aerogenes]|uniref:Uncharacterized protein n=1 Tax=Haloplanus aerogenes TaxID=660522 RepID=A0A3M0D1V9_9EURY|nr:hypothetical protein [Haloplanus aerogenes]AZH27072.1 hypothetical protein DU502_17585 [Haloplanus aerogenes]RMB13429.1 hypothetical protein ATH50_2762 [Haloplanus aerogenes]
MKGRTRASLIGMTLGVIIVTGLGLAVGIELFPSLSLSLIGLTFGGWLAERRYENGQSGNVRDDAQSV